MRGEQQAGGRRFGLIQNYIPDINWEMINRAKLCFSRVSRSHARVQSSDCVWQVCKPGKEAVADMNQFALIMHHIGLRDVYASDRIFKAYTL